MFDKKDYISYLEEILRVENTMKKEGKQLLKMIPEERCQVLLKELISDEERHVVIVKELLRSVKKNN